MLHFKAITHNFVYWTNGQNIIKTIKNEMCFNFTINSQFAEGSVDSTELWEFEKRIMSKC